MTTGRLGGGGFRGPHRRPYTSFSHPPPAMVQLCRHVHTAKVAPQWGGLLLPPSAAAPPRRRGGGPTSRQTRVARARHNPVRSRAACVTAGWRGRLGGGDGVACACGSCAGRCGAWWWRGAVRSMVTHLPDAGDSPPPTPASLGGRRRCPPSTNRSCRRTSWPPLVPATLRGRGGRMAKGTAERRVWGQASRSGTVGGRAGATGGRGCTPPAHSARRRRAARRRGGRQAVVATRAGPRFSLLRGGATARKLAL